MEDAAHEDSLGDNSMIDGRSGVEVTKRVATKYFALRQLYTEMGCKTEQGNYCRAYKPGYSIFIFQRWSSDVR